MPIKSRDVEDEVDAGDEPAAEQHERRRRASRRAGSRFVVQAAPGVACNDVGEARHVRFELFDGVGRGAFLLAAYSAGLGIPFLLAALAMKPFVALLRGMRSKFHLVEKVMGGLLVLTGIAFLTGALTDVSFWLLETFPALATLG